MGQDTDRIRRDYSLSSVAASFGLKLKQDGAEYLACCPFHSEKTESFSIFTGNDSVERFFCFGCGEKGDVLDFVQGVKGVKMPEAIRILDGNDTSRQNVKPREVEARDPYAGIKPVYPSEELLQAGQFIRLYNPKRAGDKTEWGGFKPSAVYPYRHHANGRVIGYVLRHELADGRKETPMVMRVRLPNGEQVWSRFPFPKPRMLYGAGRELPGQVIVVEGEKCKDHLENASGRAAVTWAGGTQGVKHADWSPLAGHDILIWPDNDAPGFATAREIAAALEGSAKRVRFIDITKMPNYADLPKGWDSADAVAEGIGKEGVDAIMKACVSATLPDFPAPVDPAPKKKKPEKAKDKQEAPAVNNEPSEPAAPAGESPAAVPATTGVDDDGVFWADKMVMGEKGPKPGVTKNWTLILENRAETEGMLAYDRFREEAMFVLPPPWEMATASFKPRPIKQNDLAECVEFLEGHGMTPKVSNISDVLDKIAERAPYHPVRNYFNDLPKWDGTPRVDNFLTDYLGAEDNRLNRAISRKWLCAIVSRIFVPGIKFDTCLVLQGKQGLGKSQFGRALSPLGEWVTDAVTVGDKAREVIENTRGVMIVELAELAGKSTKEINAVKSFISVQSDSARGAYRRKADVVLRQFVFYATTNDDEYLNDPTGNRRWWSVKPTHIDLEAIRADRDQLWAEVMTMYKTEKLWLDDEELQRDLDALNKTKTDNGPAYDQLLSKIPEGDMIVSVGAVNDAFTGGSHDGTRLSGAWGSHVKRALIAMGFDGQPKLMRRGKIVQRYYVRGDIGSRAFAKYDSATHSIVFEEEPKTKTMEDVF